MFEGPGIFVLVILAVVVFYLLRRHPHGAAGLITTQLKDLAAMSAPLGPALD